MKYIVVLGDGMADEPLEDLGGKTPLAYAHTPAMDLLSKKSEIGMVHTIPEGMAPGSDTANLAVLGYNPRQYYTGRSPLEALSIGIPMEPGDIALRCNLVTLSGGELPYGERRILDHSAGEIGTADAAVLMRVLEEAFTGDEFRFYTGTSYRHCTIWKGGSVVPLTPPHDVLGKKIEGYLPQDVQLRHMMEKSFDILNHHPLNEDRARKGYHKANSMWFWGAGTKPALDSFSGKTGKKGAVISAVDLLKGIAVGTKMRVIQVEGADGTLHTNYEGKAAAAVKTLLEDGDDFVYVHVEAADEMGHQGSVHNKIEAIEALDKRVIRIIHEKMKESGEAYRMLIMPDHPTPVRLRTHTSKPVPYLLYDSTVDLEKEWCYNEEEAGNSGNTTVEGYQLMDRLLQ